MKEIFQSDSIRYPSLPTDIDGFDALATLALDLRSSWNHSTDIIWRELDRELWDMTHNPWVVLQTVSRKRVEQLLGDPAFRKNLDQELQAWRQLHEATPWFQQQHADAELTQAAYFSMEFMLSEALPIYSGGLGNVAGDQLKAVSDLGVPVVGVGLLYQQGYFRQTIDAEGSQQALFPYNDPGQLPITPLRRPDGQWLRLEIMLPGYSVWLRAWQAQVGRVKLYLLDSNDAANYPAHRSITSELYGGGPELRLKQELVLGIGGWRLLEALGIAPEVCHLNEGHAAFAVLERARSFMNATGHSFEVALAATRAGNLFTTHTAVAAGFDRFSPQLIEQYLGRYATQMLGIDVQDLLALGRQSPDDHNEMFNMAYLAIRGSGAINGVSRLHGEVSRQIFEPLFPRWPEPEVPVGHITNGVHMPSWDSAAADQLWTEVCGKERWREPCPKLPDAIRKVSDTKLWRLRIDSTKSLVEFAREHLSRSLASSGAEESEVEAAKHLFDPHALTLGFARRFATYKRPNLLLHDPDRLLRLLSDPERPVQLILAGKAHPADAAGQQMIRQWVQFIRHPQARKHVIFLSDYDMLMTERLVQGVDVWVNTPRRPWEASGTSGMKVLVNGGINLSELDGWWAEAYQPELGWALGDGLEHDDAAAIDELEAEQLYQILENEVVPEFYDRDAEGIPTAWLQRMRNSMATLTPEYSAARTVRQYTEQHYLPAAKAYRERIAFDGQLATSIVNWETSLKEKWGSLRFGTVQCQTDANEHHFEVEVYLDGLDPSFVTVEMFAVGIDGGEPRRVAMQRTGSRPGPDGTPWAIYQGSVPSSESADDYTARVIPVHRGVAIPLELNLCLWQR
ncbi:alpha-glucan family phosphorylase [Rosistilla oblonga]|uniref:alpha-glucan family phosphorylase n=1 Tax=Rosistilla oblonga TaxID=2527990 RepID=UPI003A96CC67